MTSQTPLVVREWQPDTVVAALERAATSMPDRVYLDFDGQTTTFAQAEQLSNLMANDLAAQWGITSGDTVVTVLDNSADLLIAWFAINKLGAIWVPLNTSYRGGFLQHQVNDSTARLAIVDAQYLGNLTALDEELISLRTVLVRGDTGTGHESSLRVASLDDHRGANPARPEAAAAVRPGDLSMLCYTSGTTGPSKGCMISHNFILHVGHQTNLAIPPAADEVKYTCLPLFHTSALAEVTSALLSGCRIAIYPRFSVSKFWSQVERSGATSALLFSTIFPLLAAQPETEEEKRCRGQLRSVTGTKLPTELQRVWTERFGVGFLNSFAYGQTEGSRLATARIDQPLPPADSNGRIESQAFDVAILDDEDNPLQDGEVGEIAYRPKMAHVMFEGYWNRPDATVEAWRNLWMHTGDLGYVRDGCLYFVDRKQDYLRNKGENISSFEVESVFARHPELAEVAVHAVDVGITEDSIKLTAVRASGSVCTERQIWEWAQQNLPYFAVPRYIEFRAELERTINGKLQKNKLRGIGVTESTWDARAHGLESRRPRR
ncbi:AMP-binding protein [Nocardia sp. R6R-6]|uniref:AMP-binding protein n=1 Tax=Nocardia sp. R6R-6 TaxID=3459303 RepID=UPI00403DEA0F